MRCLDTSSLTFIKADPFKMKNSCSKKYLHFMWIRCCSKSISQNVWKFIQLPAESKSGVAENSEDLEITFSVLRITWQWLIMLILMHLLKHVISAQWDPIVLLGGLELTFSAPFFHHYLLSVKRRANIIQISPPCFLTMTA